MSRFMPYSPDQPYLIPPSVKDELGEDHLCFFIHRVVERLNLRVFEEAYSEEGGALYAPSLMLKVWLYAYALGITSARRLEQRIREDLPLRYLAAGAKPDNWALSAFRRRHGRALNDAFTQVLELARELTIGRWGTVSIDSTRIQSAGSRSHIDTEDQLRQERAKLRRHIRRWQQKCNESDNDEGAGTSVGHQYLRELERRLDSIPQRLERLQKSQVKRLSQSDPEARWLRSQRGFMLAYTADLAVSEDHLIVAQRVTQAPADNDSLIPMVQQVEHRCKQRPVRVLADAGYYSNENLRTLAKYNIDAYIPDSNLSREMKTGHRLNMGHVTSSDPHLLAMRRKLRSFPGRLIYKRRMATVEPVIGTLKIQRNLIRFRLRSLEKVATEWTLATIAYNITRLHRHC